MKEAIQKAIEGGWKIGDGRWDGEKIHNIEIKKSQWMGYAKKGLFGREFNPFAWKDIAIVKFKEEEVWVPLAETLLDHLWWQALGKAIGHGKGQRVELGGGFWTEDMWLKDWHRFIDHLAEGKDAESFFNELLK